MDNKKEINKKIMPFIELSTLQPAGKSTPVITRGQCAVQILSNYLDTGVITADEIDHTTTLLAAMDDNDLLASLIESHQCRESAYAIKAFRCPN